MYQTATRLNSKIGQTKTQNQKIKIPNHESLPKLHAHPLVPDHHPMVRVRPLGRHLGKAHALIKTSSAEWDDSSRRSFWCRLDSESTREIGEAWLGCSRVVVGRSGDSLLGEC